jgi:hypothetical protein
MQQAGFRSDFAEISRHFDTSDMAAVPGGEKAMKLYLARTPYAGGWRIADWAPLCLRASLRWAATHSPQLFALLAQQAAQHSRTVGQMPCFRSVPPPPPAP